MTYRIRISCPKCTSKTGLHGAQECFGWAHPGYDWMGGPFSGTDVYEDIDDAKKVAEAMDVRNPLGWVYEVVDMNEPLPELPKWTSPSASDSSSPTTDQNGPDGPGSGSTDTSPPSGPSSGFSSSAPSKSSAGESECPF
jgi:hypothetical protein